MTKSILPSYHYLLLFCFSMSPLLVSANDDEPRVAVKTLYTFQDIQERRTWFPLNDNIMGGVSTGDFNFTEDNTLIFSGKVALENKGGFASIRSKKVAVNLEDVKSFKLRVKGDGKSYYFNISSSNFVADPGYQVGFKTKKGVWEEIIITVDDFAPAFGGHYSKANLQMSEIKLMGIIISDKQAGTFNLEIDWIKAF
jgi:NADH dehydrogenase [ubiquinone] 1 alpha subcomplex assembly factor 1